MVRSPDGSTPQHIGAVGWRLVAVAGPAMAPIPLPSSGVLQIGRAMECQVCLADPSVSRRHAQMSVRMGRWLLTDLDSRAGTYVNGVKIPGHQATVLEAGDLVRIGPWEMRLVSPGTVSAATSTLDDTSDRGRSIQTLRGDSLGSSGVAQQRLHLVLECASALNAARDEEGLARSLVRSALEGSGYRRGALVRRGDSDDSVRIVAAVDDAGNPVTDLVVSRSLLREASGGLPAELSRKAGEEYSRSIAEQGIHSALCVPLVMDGGVAGFLYLDARGAEGRVRGDAAEFCLALARVGSLAMANLMRGELEARHRALQQQIAAAHEAQRLIIPAESGVVGGVRYALAMRPGLFVAGDLFDVIELEGGRIAAVLGDVAGEGVGAGLVMAATQAHLHASLRHCGDPVEAVRLVNEYLCAHAARNKFVTLWVGVFDPAGGTLRYVDAGHGHWLLARATSGGGAVVERGRSNGIPVGIDPEFAFDEIETAFAPGDRVVLLSDGILEQSSPEGAEFGIERVIGVLGAGGAFGSEAGALLSAVTAFAGTAQLDDDATAAVLGLTG